MPSLAAGNGSRDNMNIDTNPTLLQGLIMKKNFTSRVIALLVLPLMLYCTPALSKDTLVIGMTQFPASFHPNFESMLAKYYALNLTMRPITAYNDEWETVCMLCTSLPTIENGGALVTDLGDGKQGVAVTYTLHPQARWGDGTPVTTRDVEYTIEIGKNPQSGVVGAEFYRRVLSVDVIDDKTFTLQMDRLDYKYSDLAIYLIPEHIDRPAFSDPGEYRNRNTYDTDTYNPGLYFGPYRIVNVSPGSHIEYVKNDTWWGPEPAFDKVVIRIIENTAALEANLLSGSIDFISGMLGITLNQALTMEKRHPDDYEYIYRPGLIYEHLDLNLDNPILADIRVRKALLHAIDRQAISDQLFEGNQPVADVFVSPLDPAFDPAISRYAFDPEMSRQLLDEAGWEKMVDGVRHNADDEPLRLEFGTTAGARVRETIQQVLQGQWQEVGIDVRINNEPARVFFGETVAKRKFPALAMFAWVSDPESSPRTTLHSTEIPSEANAWQGSNYTGYRNEEMDELIDALEITLEKEARHAIWSRIQQLYTNELPVLPLYFRSSPFVIPKWLKGVQPTGNTSTTTMWIENWTVENPN